jgi:rod shape-determining protein MreC
VVLTLIALSWMTLDLRAAAPGGGTPDRGALAVFAPVQEALATVVHPATSAVRWIDDQRALHERLDQLRGTDAELRAARASNADLATENRRLRDLMGMRERMGHRTVGARALGTPPGDPGGGVLITAGTAEGVAPGMTVTDATGLVGRVVAVTATHARVELATSPHARYAVRVVPGDLPGRLWGAGDGRLVVELDDPSGALPTGARVVTRAFEGSTVPDGLPVGVVQDDAVDGQSHTVRPQVRAEALDLVQVVVDAPAQPSTLIGGAVTAGADALPAPPRPGER